MKLIEGYRRLSTYENYIERKHKHIYICRTQTLFKKNSYIIIIRYLSPVKTKWFLVPTKVDKVVFTKLPWWVVGTERKGRGLVNQETGVMEVSWFTYKDRIVNGVTRQSKMIWTPGSSFYTSGLYPKNHINYETVKYWTRLVLKTENNLELLLKTFLFIYHPRYT